MTGKVDVSSFEVEEDEVQEEEAAAALDLIGIFTAPCDAVVSQRTL